MNFDIPNGFNAKPDGRGGWVVSRPPIRIRYTCDTCPHYREEMTNKKGTRIHVLPCYNCNRFEYEIMRRKIKLGLI